MSDPVSELKRELLAAAERQQGQGRWFKRSDVQQGRRRRLLVLALVTLVVAVGTASAIGGVRDFILDRGFVGLPPQGATPSTPESGELVLHWEGRSASHAHRLSDGTPIAPLFQVWVYGDGRMIWSREGRPSSSPIPKGANESTSGYLEQRLTPEGIELLRSAVAELFDRTRTLLETVPADDAASVPPVPRRHLFPGPGFFWGSVELPDGDRLVRLGWDYDRSASPGGTPATPEQLSALRRVDALLTDPVSVLPASAWAVRKVRAYVPSHYAVCLRASPPKDESQLLPLLPARAADVLRDRSWTRVEGDIQVNSDSGPLGVGDRWVEYCSKLTTAEARQVAEGLSGLDPAPGEGQVRLAYQLAQGADWWEGTSIYFEPYFPDGQITCSACG